jgi:spore maturation protein SpmA
MKSNRATWLIFIILGIIILVVNGQIKDINWKKLLKSIKKGTKFLDDSDYIITRKNKDL